MSSAQWLRGRGQGRQHTALQAPAHGSRMALQTALQRLRDTELKLMEHRRASEVAEASSREALAGERRALNAAREDAQHHRRRADSVDGHLRTAASNLGEQALLLGCSKCALSDFLVGLSWCRDACFWACCRHGAVLFAAGCCHKRLTLPGVMLLHACKSLTITNGVHLAACAALLHLQSSSLGTGKGFVTAPFY